MAFPLSVRRSVTEDNLRISSEAISREAEARLSHIDDLARIAGADITRRLTPEETVMRLSDLLVRATPVCHRSVLPEHREEVAGLLPALSVYDRVRFIRAFLLGTEKTGFLPSVEDFIPVGIGAGKIAYVRNNYTDEVFDLAAALFDDPRAGYEKDYESACAAVRDGEADACILPYRDAMGERARSALTLLRAYDLRVMNVVEVTDREMRPIEYALAARILPPPVGETAYLFSFDCDDSTFRDLLAAAQYLGFTASEAVFRWGSGEVLLTGGAEPTALLLWLSLFVPAHRLDGLYPIS